MEESQTIEYLDTDFTEFMQFLDDLLKHLEVDPYCTYLKMENFLRPKEKVGILNLPTVTIEHILPQNPNLSKDWQDELGDDWKGKQSLYLNCLGNLTITELNSELGDLSFPEKKEKGFAPN